MIEQRLEVNAGSTRTETLSDAIQARNDYEAGILHAHGQYPPLPSWEPHVDLFEDRAESEPNSLLHIEGDLMDQSINQSINQ